MISLIEIILSHLLLHVIDNIHVHFWYKINKKGGKSCPRKLPQSSFFVKKKKNKKKKVFFF
jgi:hypothetical protein